MNCAPVAALLFEPGRAPALADVQALAQRNGRFAVNVPVDGSDGSGGSATWLELLRDGLTFDLAGFDGVHALPDGAVVHQVGFEPGPPLRDHAALTIAPGPHLAGAAHLLPVVRVLAALLVDLLELPGAVAVVWLPAHLASTPGWFTRAVGAWLVGGPFPALALAAIDRRDAIFTSWGLRFLIGQEFRFVARDGVPDDRDSRLVLRLADWLVAHGRVDAGREVVLAGAGAVWLEPDGAGLVNARRL